jgi:hypothetical protein
MSMDCETTFEEIRAAGRSVCPDCGRAPYLHTSTEDPYTEPSDCGAPWGPQRCGQCDECCDRGDQEYDRLVEA